MASKTNEALSAMFRELENFITTKTVVGEPVNINDTIILPLVDVSFGVGAGVNESGEEKKSSGLGAGALGAKIQPSAVLVIKDGNTRLVNIKKQDSITKLIDLVPEILNKFNIGNKNKEKDEDVENKLDEMKSDI